jgi:hypothetical protein
MHDLLNNILTIISLVVHTIVQHFIKKRGNYDIADHNNEKSKHQNIIERKGINDEKTNARE